MAAKRGEVTRMRAVFEGDTHLSRTLGQGLTCSVTFWRHHRETRDLLLNSVSSTATVAFLRLWNGDKGRKRKLGTRKRGREKSRLAWLAGMAAGWLAPEIYDCLPFFSSATPNSGPPGRGRGRACMALLGGKDACRFCEAC